MNERSLRTRSVANPLRRWMLCAGLAWFAGQGIGTAWAAGESAAGNTFLWLAIILVVARLSMLVERAGIPAVLGELLAGIVLGNLALAGIGVFDRIEGDPVIAVFAELGVVILLFQIGLETRLDDMRRVGARAFAVAVVGAAVPFVLGSFVVGPLLLPSAGLNAHLFLGAALSATSVGITGRVFRDLGQLHLPEARIVLGAAVIDDVLGLVILAIVSSLVREGSVSAAQVAWIVVEAVLFLGASIAIGRLLAPHLSRVLVRISAGTAMKLTLVLATGLFLAWLAQAIGLAAIIGAFAAGLIFEPVFLADFDRPPLDREIRPLLDAMPPVPASRLREMLDRHAAEHHQHLIEPLGLVFVPVFFVYTGMQVRLDMLADGTVLLLAGAITVTAFAGKLVSGLAAGPVNRWVVGWGMAPRGEVGLIFAVVGRQLGVVDDRMFAIVVAMVVLTTLVTPPVLVRLLRRSKTRAAGDPP